MQVPAKVDLQQSKKTGVFNSLHSAREAGLRRPSMQDATGRAASLGVVAADKHTHCRIDQIEHTALACNTSVAGFNMFQMKPALCQSIALPVIRLVAGLCCRPLALIN